MPNYEIVDYYYKHILEDSDLINIDSVEKKILTNDSKGTADSWIKGSKDWKTNVNKGIGSSGVSLGERVDIKNEEYKIEIKQQIDEAKIKTDLDDIEIEKYSDSTVTELNAAIKERKEELEGIGKETKDIIDTITKASSYEDFPELPSKRELEETYGKKGAQDILTKESTKREDFGTADEELVNRITPRIDAATLDRLGSLRAEVRDKTHTEEIEEMLLGDIDAREEELRAE